MKHQSNLISIPSPIIQHPPIQSHIHPFNKTTNQSIIHPFIQSYIHPSTHSPIHPTTYSIQGTIHPITDPSNHQSFIRPITYLPNHPSNHSPVNPNTQPPNNKSSISPIKTIIDKSKIIHPTTN